MRVYLLGWGFVAFVCALVCSFGVFICVLEMILLLRQDFFCFGFVYFLTTSLGATQRRSLLLEPLGQ